MVRLSYTIKFIVKDGEMGPDYIAMPLEALWESENTGEFDYNSTSGIKWTLCVMQPYFVTLEHVNEGIEKTKKKKGINEEFLNSVIFQPFQEGLCAQLFHIGPYKTKGNSIDKLRAYIDVNGYQVNGKHHEIYIGDPRRAKPENLKTILRQPVVKGEGIM